MDWRPCFIGVNLTYMYISLDPVVQKMDNAIQQINPYPAKKLLAIKRINCYPADISVGETFYWIEI